MTKSIRTRFLLVYALIAVIFTAALALSFSQWENARDRLLRTSVEGKASRSALAVSSFVSGLLTTEQHIAAGLPAALVSRPPSSTATYSQADPEVRGYLSRVLSVAPSFRSLSLVTRDRVISEGVSAGSPSAVRADPAVRSLQSSARWSIVPAASEQSEAVVHLAVRAPAQRDRDDVLLGVGVVPGALLGTGAPQRNGVIFLASADGHVFARGGAVPAPVEREWVATSHSAASVSSFVLREEPTRRDWVVGTAPVGKTGWFAVSVLPHNADVDPFLVQERAERIVLGAVLMAGFVLIWWLTGGVTHSIRRLRRAAQAVAGGDIGYRVRFSTGSEMDDLVESFNNMAERLEAHQDLLHDRNQQLNVLLRVVEGLRTERDPQDLLRRITQDADFLTGAGLAFLAQVEDEQLRLKEWWDGARWVSQDLVWRQGQGAPGWVWLHHDTLTSDDYGAERHGASETMAGIELRNYVCAPMVVPNGTVAGVLLVANKSGGASFTEDDVRIMELLARHAGVALEVEAAFQRERRVAATMQKAMLPDVDATIGGLTIAREYQAASDETELGGDFYDVIPLPDDRLGLVIADVSGKGLRAAVQTAAVKYALRAYALEDSNPSRVLERLNMACFNGPQSRGFVTLFFGVIDLRTLEMSYANAGHQPPLLRRASGVVENLVSPGVVLGVVNSSLVTFMERTVSLEPGDTLVLYTDGLSEARSGDEFLDTEGIQSLLGQMDLSAHETAKRLLRGATAFADGILRDDVALLVVKVPERTSGSDHIERRIASAFER